MLNKVRELKKEAHGAKAAGFTIIEVMIVLAIAGLIMAIVFLAIPALQKNNRNTQRKNDASRLAGLVSEYNASNNGAMPANVVAALGSPTWSIMTTVSGPTAVVAGSVPTTVAVDTMVLYTNAGCSGNALTAGSSARQFAVFFGAEGATATQCIAS